MMPRAAILLSLLGTLAHSAEVIQASKTAMAISQASDRPYRIDDAICVVRDNKKIACGRVAKATPKGAIVRLIVVKAEVKKGDEVIRVTSRGSAGTSSETVTPPTFSKNTFGGGFLYTPAYSYTLIFYERALSSHFSVRIEPNYFSAASDNNSFTMAALGGKLGISFDSTEPFKGFWAGLAVGYYSFTYTPAGTLTLGKQYFGALTGSLEVGWRFKLGKFIGLGIGVGAHYLPISSNLADPNTANAVLAPFSTIQFGGAVTVSAVY
ncbi:MAG: hypothetical protein HYR96_12140 [Deltaproteobacteria bacterium]|nr:hypothetical protein [Deltaproteobacteria bacterium]MBI3294793.1 hypothetical protein [Deltaproteobacteria bacterium]